MIQNVKINQSSDDSRDDPQGIRFDKDFCELYPNDPECIPQKDFVSFTQGSTVKMIKFCDLTQKGMYSLDKTVNYTQGILNVFQNRDL